MEDRFSPGAFAGLIGDVILEIYFTILKFLKVINLTYCEYGKILIMGQPNKGTLAFVVGMAFEFLIGGFLGVILSYMIKYTTKKLYLFKAIFIAIGSWLFFLSPGTFYRLPLFDRISPQNSVLMLIGSLLWGIVSAISLKILTKDFTAFYKEF